ncbi:MAG: 5-(carboxyamino)imidazole ribonucleotide mutase [Actinomycetota bacterium]|nr:5-(carboxyamino)imidazole ribonucleotide mutase [Actinomycetota bacterium]
MGSSSDAEVMKGAEEALSELGVPFEVNVMSAHRNPARVSEYALSAKERGIKVLICGAGKAAHLAGVVAAHTSLPVIGVPIYSKDFGGMDSLLSMVQMPSGVPVATVAVSGAKNAGILAAQMLALSDPAIAKAVADFKSALSK